MQPQESTTQSHAARRSAGALHFSPGLLDPTMGALNSRGAPTKGNQRKALWAPGLQVTAADQGTGGTRCFEIFSLSSGRYGHRADSLGAGGHTILTTSQ